MSSSGRGQLGKMTQSIQGTGPIRVIVADDHAILRQGLAILLEAQPAVTVVAQAGDGREAVEATGTFKPDVAIIDVAMPQLNGIEATRQIKARFPTTKVVILSAYGDAAALGEAITAGASAFIIKKSDIEELVLALKLVMSGNTYFSRELSERLDVTEVVFAARNHTALPSDLTSREREVLQLIAEGNTMKAVASLLFISVKTVEGHNSRIMAKAGAKNRADLVRYAIGAGLVRFDATPSPGEPEQIDSSMESASNADESIGFGRSHEYFRAS